MKIIVNTNLGNVGYTFEIDEEKEIDSLLKAAVLGNPPSVCDECGNKDNSQFKLQGNKDNESNIYINVECNRCGARAKLGLYKSGNYFFHKFKKYVKQETK